MRVKEAIPDTKMIWHVEDSLIALPELKNQKEWIGTTIVWEIEQNGENAKIKITHLGLSPILNAMISVPMAGYNFLAA